MLPCLKIPRHLSAFWLGENHGPMSRDGCHLSASVLSLLDRCKSSTESTDLSREFPVAESLILFYVVLCCFMLLSPRRPIFEMYNMYRNVLFFASTVVTTGILLEKLAELKH